MLARLSQLLTAGPRWRTGRSSGASPCANSPVPLLPVLSDGHHIHTPKYITLAMSYGEHGRVTARRDMHRADGLVHCGISCDFQSLQVSESSPRSRTHGARADQQMHDPSRRPCHQERIRTCRAHRLPACPDAPAPAAATAAAADAAARRACRCTASQSGSAVCQKLESGRRSSGSRRRRRRRNGDALATSSRMVLTLAMPAARPPMMLRPLAAGARHLRRDRTHRCTPAMIP